VSASLEKREKCRNREKLIFKSHLSLHFHIPFSTQKKRFQENLFFSCVYHSFAEGSLVKLKNINDYWIMPFKIELL
jgi:hypothetical protein